MWGMSEGISFGCLCANSPCKISKENIRKQNLSSKIGEGILKHSLKSVTGEGSLLNFVRKLSSDSLKASLN